MQCVLVFANIFRMRIIGILSILIKVLILFGCAMFGVKGKSGFVRGYVVGHVLWISKKS